nr:uncharacterized protein LOC127319600 [Lolium perenne]
MASTATLLDAGGRRHYRYAYADTAFIPVFLRNSIVPIWSTTRSALAHLAAPQSPLLAPASLAWPTPPVPANSCSTYHRASTPPANAAHPTSRASPQLHPRWPKPTARLACQRPRATSAASHALRLTSSRPLLLCCSSTSPARPRAHAPRQEIAASTARKPQAAPPTFPASTRRTHHHQLAPLVRRPWPPARCSTTRITRQGPVSIRSAASTRKVAQADPLSTRAAAAHPPASLDRSRLSLPLDPPGSTAARPAPLGHRAVGPRQLPPHSSTTTAPAPPSSGHHRPWPRLPPARATSTGHQAQQQQPPLAPSPPNLHAPWQATSSTFLRLIMLTLNRVDQQTGSAASISPAVPAELPRQCRPTQPGSAAVQVSDNFDSNFCPKF